LWGFSKTILKSEEIVDFAIRHILFSGCLKSNSNSNVCHPVLNAFTSHDTSNATIEIAKTAVKGVKFLVGAALHVFELIIKYGLQSILDVKNCQFEIQLTTVFGVVLLLLNSELVFFKVGGKNISTFNVGACEISLLFLRCKIDLTMFKREDIVDLFLVGAALHVFELIIKYGLQRILDVKNCQFEIQLTTSDKLAFEVSCEVNAFRTGWHTFEFEFDFRLIQIHLLSKATCQLILIEVNKCSEKPHKYLQKIEHDLFRYYPYILYCWYLVWFCYY
jgi:hypothetical protein